MIRDIIERRLEELAYVIDHIAVGIETCGRQLQSAVTTKTAARIVLVAAAVTLILW